MADLIVPADLEAAVPRLAGSPDQAALISAASAIAERYCSRVFAKALAISETLDGQNQPRIWLARPPIVAIASIMVNGVALDNSQGTAWVYDPADNSGEVQRGNGQYDPRFSAWFPRGRRNVVVVYDGGFAPIPFDVKRAAIVLAKHIADGSKTTGLFQSESIGDYSYAINQAALALPPLAAMLLEPYVLRRIV